MGGKNEQVQTKEEKSKTEPWAPAQPLLQSILNQAGGLSTAVTPGQSMAAANLAAGAAGIPNMGPQASNVAAGRSASTTRQSDAEIAGHTVGCADHKSRLRDTGRDANA